MGIFDGIVNIRQSCAENFVELVRNLVKQQKEIRYMDVGNARHGS